MPTREKQNVSADANDENTAHENRAEKTMRGILDNERRSFFGMLARKCALATGRASAFIISCVAVIIWALAGPFFHYSDTWQLVINTVTTVLTFLMVFLIQNSQNRDAAAMQIKLDELLRIQKEASNALLDLEELSEDELESIREDFLRLAREKRSKLKTPAPERP